MLNTVSVHHYGMDTLADRMRLAIDSQKDKTQSGLAAYCGVTRAAVSQWVHGETANLKMEYLFAAADYLNIEARWLATGEGEMMAQDRSAMLDLSDLTPEQAVQLRRLVDAFKEPRTNVNTA